MSMPAVVLENTSASAQTNVPFTFGQVFKQGDLPAGSAVALIGPGGATLPCQVNVHNSHPDGSVRHASLSVVVPNMAESAAVLRPPVKSLRISRSCSMRAPSAKLTPTN